MGIRIKATILPLIAATMMLAAFAPGQGWGYHRGWHRYHVYRNHQWGYVWHPAGWTIPAAWVGPAVVAGAGVTLGWGYHPGWHRYHVWRNNRWGYVWHPAGWSVPAAWVGPALVAHGQRGWRHH